jgi:hypothetical protein
LRGVLVAAKGFSLVITSNLLLLGVGQCASWVAKLTTTDRKLYGTTREASKTGSLLEKGIEPLLISPWSDKMESKVFEHCKDSNVLVSFPPDGETDEQLAPLCHDARSIIYISSTGVYGKTSGVIDEGTEVDGTSSSANQRLRAEKVWLDRGASILRAPALYDCQSGLHKRLLAGTYAMPGNGENFVSRIHLKDLARIILACFEKPLPPGSIYLVGDLEPATHKEVATWLCEQLKIPVPASVPLDTVSPTLRNNRQICSKRILHELGIELEFPTYREGYKDCLQGLVSTVSP